MSAFTAYAVRILDVAPLRAERRLMPRLHRVLKAWYGVKIGDWNVDEATEAIWRNKKHSSREWTGSEWRACSFADKEQP